MSDIVAELGEAIIALAVPDPVKRSALAFAALAQANRDCTALKSKLDDSDFQLGEAIKDVAELDTQVVELENRVQELLNEVRLAEAARDAMRVERDEVKIQKEGVEAELREALAKQPRFVLEYEDPGSGGWHRCYPMNPAASNAGVFTDHAEAQRSLSEFNALNRDCRYRVRQL